MPEHDFTALFDRYPMVIEAMLDVFDSHQFILGLARRHQGLYIEALFSYCHEPAPFRIVHRLLSRRLNACTRLVQRVGDVVSANIF